jgi:cytochrome c553
MRHAVPLLIFLLACSTPVNIHVGGRMVGAPVVAISNPSLVDGDAFDGRRAFVSSACTDCHRVETDPGLPRTPRSSEGPMLRVYRDVRASELAKHIRTVGPPMNAYARKLTARQLVDIVAYLRTPPVPRG